MTQEEKDSLLQLIEQASGFISAIAQTKGVCRRTVERWVAADPDLKAAIKNARDNTKDFAESVILKAMKSKNENVALKAAKFYLDSQAKDRGYGYRKMDITSGGEPLRDSVDRMSDEDLRSVVDKNMKLLGYERKSANSGNSGPSDS